MRIDVEIDTKELLLRLHNGEKKLAYAAVRAINKTALRIQQAEFASIRRKFTIRNERFFFGSPDRPGGVAARLKPKADVKQGRPYAEVSVAEASTIASQRRLLLGIFERGGPRKEGGKTTAVPLTGRPARPTFAQPVPKEFTFAGLGFKAFRGRKKLTRTTTGGRKRAIGLFGEFGRLGLPEGTQGDVQWKGKQRTFLLEKTEKAPLGGVFQRTGPKREDIRMIYAFKKGIRLDSRLEFVRVATTTAAAWFKEELEKQVIEAIKFSRGRGL